MINIIVREFYRDLIYLDNKDGLNEEEFTFPTTDKKFIVNNAVMFSDKTSLTVTRLLEASVISTIAIAVQKIKNKIITSTLKHFIKSLKI